LFWLLLAGTTGAAVPGAQPASASGPAAPASTAAVNIVEFRTDAAPRVDAVFGDVGALRAVIDRFLSLQGEMEGVRDDLSSAVHETLAALAGPPAASTGAGIVTVSTTKTAGAPANACPASIGAPYARALAAGGHYLALGQQLQAAYREIRRADDLGDTMGLTPDYRLKVKRTRELHQQLLTDYREMRVAFYDQLGAELRHAGCKIGARGLATVAAAPAGQGTNPDDPGAWEIDEPAAEAALDAPAAPRAEAPTTIVVPFAPPAPSSSPSGSRTDAAAEPPASASAAPAIWIEIDNTLCKQPTHLAIDGQALGEIGAGKKVSVRARSGPHEICALPASDGRACGDAGTRRSAYLHEGWTLTVHCNP
jgi:hypothetical protein